ncbi:sulfite exporter TauE/SafE family protein [Limibaculum sp. FT325]|uniref:sulfite exporter TauE/SafE family protein n=1 Tax=Thermohalobaculum sediminis TaxID=2939436 RepID=UPI0020C04979|nr:sulfite exporter TauE/SafE family protein [Limibaculum sediminis]MCL5777619.1 sulfite exporter TauE/SafE family protein [Limibaculum sediminis]
MDLVSPLAAYDPAIIAAATLIMLLGGFVKGAVGFAMPMIALSGLGSLLSAQEAVAILILPTCLSNFWQTFRQGGLAARDTAVRFWRLNLFMGLSIGVIAQFVPGIRSEDLFVALGLVIVAAAGAQLSGWRPRVPENGGRRATVEIVAGLVAGVIGGVSGVWGPPVILLLVALDTPKTEMVRAQGVSYLIGSVVLVAAHLQSGLLDATTVPMSALMCLPAAAGMWAGLVAQDRMDQARFRRMTLVVLCLAGLNLLRRGLF